MLNTGLDADTLAICMRLCENGANPEALALVIQELRRETANYRVSCDLIASTFVQINQINHCIQINNSSSNIIL